MVCLPDGRVSATMVVTYLKAALRLTYADDQALFQRIQGFSFTVEICQFVVERHERGEELYFICDQMNARDHFPDTATPLVPRTRWTPYRSSSTRAVALFHMGCLGKLQSGCTRQCSFEVRR